MNYFFSRISRAIGVFFRTIRAFVSRKLMGIASGLRRLTNFSRHATKAATSSLQEIATAAQEPSSKSDYVETGNLLISKALIVRIVLIIVAVGLIGYFLVWPFVLSHFLTARFYVGDKRVEDWSGRVIVYSDEKKTVPLYSGRLENGVLQGDCKQYDSNGVLEYEGQIHDGVRDGSGKEYKDGILIYEGQLQNGERSGTGKEYEDGSLVYEGQLRNGEHYGSGREYKNGELIYEGQFTAGLYDGIGTLYENGNIRFSGQYENGKRSGNGREYQEGALVYDGQFQNDLYEGRGKLYDKGVLIYDGSFHAGKKEGTGTAYYYPSGKVSYQGQYLAGKRDGNGVAFTEDGGKCYEGSFAEDEYNGEGTLYFGDGSQLEASFQGGVPSGNVVWMKNGFLYYRGEWTDDAPNGFGTLYNKAGKKIFEGSFLGGTIDGSKLLGSTADEFRAVLCDGSVKNETKKKGFLIIAEELGLTALCSFQTDKDESRVCKLLLSAPEKDDWIKLLPGMEHTTAMQWPVGSKVDRFLSKYSSQTGVNLASGRYDAESSETDQQRITALYSDESLMHVLLLIWERSDLEPTALPSEGNSKSSKVEKLLNALDKMIALDGTAGSNGATFGGTATDKALAGAETADDAVALADAMIDFWLESQRRTAQEELLKRNNTLLEDEKRAVAMGVGSSGRVKALEKSKLDLEADIEKTKTAIKRAEIQASNCGVTDLSGYALEEMLIIFDPGGKDISSLSALAASYMHSVGSEMTDAEIDKLVKDSLLNLSDTHTAAKLALTQHQMLDENADSALNDYSMGLCTKAAWFKALDDEALARVDLYAAMADFSKQANHFNQLTGGWVSKIYRWHKDVFEPLFIAAILPDEPEPTEEPTEEPTAEPTAELTPTPTAEPTAEPTPCPTEAPTQAPEEPTDPPAGASDEPGGSAALPEDPKGQSGNAEKTISEYEGSRIWRIIRL